MGPFVSLTGSGSLGTWSARLTPFLWDLHYEQWAMSATAVELFREETVRCLRSLSSFPPVGHCRGRGVR